MVYPLNNLGGIAHGNTVSGDVADYNAACTNDAAVADGHARADSDITAYPAAFAYSYGTAHLPLVAVIGIDRMFCGEDVDTWGYQSLAPYVHAAAVKYDTAKIDENTFICKDKVAVIAVEWRLHIYVVSRVGQQFTCDGCHCGLMILRDV